jgi:hypothetical protein
MTQVPKTRQDLGSHLGLIMAGTLSLQAPFLITCRIFFTNVRGGPKLEGHGENF